MRAIAEGPVANGQNEALRIPLLWWGSTLVHAQEPFFSITEFLSNKNNIPGLSTSARYRLTSFCHWIPDFGSDLARFIGKLPPLREGEDTRFSSLDPAHQVRLLAALGDGGTSRKKAPQLLDTFKKVLLQPAFYELVDNQLPDVKVDVIDWVTRAVWGDMWDQVSQALISGRFELLQLVKRYDRSSGSAYSMPTRQISSAVTDLVMWDPAVADRFERILRNYRTSFWSMEPLVHERLATSISELKSNLGFRIVNRAALKSWGESVQLLLALLVDDADQHYSAETSFYSLSSSEKKAVIDSRTDIAVKWLKSRL